MIFCVVTHSILWKNILNVKKKICRQHSFVISVIIFVFIYLGFFVLFLCLYIDMLFDYVRLYCIGHCDISTSYTLYGSMEINVNENEN
jgi:hypothetical protein